MWAVVGVKNTVKPPTNAKMEVNIQGTQKTTDLPTIPAMAIRKVGFAIDKASIQEKGEYTCILNLQIGNNVADTQELVLEGRDNSEHYK